MKLYLLLLFMLPLASIAQNDTKQIDNVIKTYDASKVTSIRIDNNSNNFKLKTWNKKQVQMSTYVEVEDKASLEKFNFRVKERNGVLKIEVALVDDNNTTYSVYNDAEGASIQAKMQSKQAEKDAIKGTQKNNNVNLNEDVRAIISEAIKSVDVEKITKDAMKGLNFNNAHTNSCSSTEEITIMIPEGMELEISNNSGNIDISSNLKKLLLNSNSGNVNALDIDDLELDSKSSNFEFGNINKAEVYASSSNFTFGNIETLLINTKFSNYDMENVNTLTLTNSQSDNFEMAILGSLKGSFSFSTFRIQKLTNMLDINANSGGIKIRTLDATVSYINIDGKYADIDLSAKNLPSYSLIAKTKYSSIRSNGKILESTNEEDELKDIKGDGSKTKINIVCNSCSITIK